MASVTNSALSTLTELSGLFISIAAGAGAGEATAGTGTAAVFATVLPSSKVTPNPKSMLMLQDLKAGRLSAMVLGHIACHFQRLGQVDTGKVVGTSSEPKDYARLPVSTSWLRALWDGLWEPLQMGTAQRALKSYAKSLELLLYTVHSLPTPLPAVNWFPLLTQLITFEPSLMAPAVLMASKHATTSTSLMEFLIMSLSNFKAKDESRVHSADTVTAEELFVGEEGLGRILTLGGLPLLVQGEDQALAELDKVRGLDGLAKKVTLPGSRVVDLVEKLFRVLFFNANGTIKTDEDPEVEVLQLVFLDTLSHHMRRPRSTAGPNRTRLSNQPALSDDAKELLGELRAVVLRVFYQLSFTRFLTGQRVLRRLADLSLMSISHLDAAQLSLSGSVVDQPDAGARVLKEAVGIASLYRAGYLTSQQEGRLTQVAQSALLILSRDSHEEAVHESTNRRFAESAISVLLYAMNAGVGERPTTESITEAQQHRTNTLRLIWLQRILDLLVLLSSQSEVYTNGLTLLLGGAVLLWWEDPTECSSTLQTFGFAPVSATSEGHGTAGRGDDAEALLLSMADDHEHQLESSSGAVLSMDDNIVEDDMFEQWHSRFQQSVSLVITNNDHDGEHGYRHRAVSDRMSLILPDIVMTARAGVTVSAAAASDNQIASRLLRMALDPQMGASQRQFLVVLLRRMEELVPNGQSWVLK